MVDLERSASHTTTSLFSRPSSARARPKASRVAGPGFSSCFIWAVLICAAMLLKFLQRDLHFVGGWSHAVEFGIVLHKRHTLALYGVSHNAGRFTFGGIGLAEGALNGGEVVTVDFQS